MDDRADDIVSAARDWLGRFEAALAPADPRAIAPADPEALASLFHADCHWRDVLALTGTYTTLAGRDDVMAALAKGAAAAGPTGFRLAEGRTAPRRVMRAGTAAIEAIFGFETRIGRGSGVLRLTAGGGAAS